MLIRLVSTIVMGILRWSIKLTKTYIKASFKRICMVIKYGNMKLL